MIGTLTGQKETDRGTGLGTDLVIGLTVDHVAGLVTGHVTESGIAAAVAGEAGPL